MAISYDFMTNVTRFNSTKSTINQTTANELSFVRESYRFYDILLSNNCVCSISVLTFASTIRSTRCVVLVMGLSSQCAMLSYIFLHFHFYSYLCKLLTQIHAVIPVDCRWISCRFSQAPNNKIAKRNSKWNSFDTVISRSMRLMIAIILIEPRHWFEFIVVMSTTITTTIWMSSTQLWISY